MKRIINSIAAILLNIIVIWVLLVMAENQDRGQSTNPIEVSGQVTRKIFQDFKAGWQNQGNIDKP